MAGRVTSRCGALSAATMQARHVVARGVPTAASSSVAMGGACIGAGGALGWPVASRAAGMWTRGLRVIGQPTGRHNPHLMRAEELTPGIAASEFRARRSELMAAMPAGSAAVALSHPTPLMSNDIPYLFRQRSDFIYLCGLNEPDCALVMEKGRDGAVAEDFRTTLFVRPSEPSRELWDGPRCGLDGATEHFGADAALPIECFGPFVAKMLAPDNANCPAHLFFDDTTAPVPHPKLHAALRESVAGAARQWTDAAAADTAAAPATAPTLHKLASLVERQRLVKSPAEQDVMRASGAISGDAFCDVMRATRPGVGEHELSAAIEWHCRRRGSTRLAYPPVVAGGARANTLHYVTNDRVLQGGELVLMDAGGELHGYASDITRTWPVSGSFSEPQRLLYEAVLRVQKRCVELCSTHVLLGSRDGTRIDVVVGGGGGCGSGGGEVTPSAVPVTLDRLHVISVQLMEEELKRLGFTGTGVSRVRQLYPHHVSHWLGMDTHDTPSASRSLPLRPGMVLTVEPGLYVPADLEGCPPEFRGIGIRIEDDVLVGPDGRPEVLTGRCPKDVDDIEALMRDANMAC